MLGGSWSEPGPWAASQPSGERAAVQGAGGAVGGRAVQASSSSLSGTSLRVIREGGLTPGDGGSAGSEPSSLRGGGARQRSCPSLIEFLQGGRPLPPAELVSAALPGPGPIPGLSPGSLDELLLPQLL